MATELTIANKQHIQLNTLKSLLNASRDAIASRLPVHLNADRMIKVALTAINKDSKLLLCTRESITLSVMQAAELGLEPGGSLGEGYMVPYNCKVKDERGQERWEMQAKFIPGYRGLIVLARRSGEIANIFAEAVYKGDKFDVELGLNPKLVHVPDYDSDMRDDVKNMTFTYAVAKFKDGSYQFVVLSRKQIEKLRARSKAATFGPWVTDFEEMAKKTGIRRLAKYLPLSVELAKALELQGAAESGDFVVMDGGGTPEFQLGEETPEIEKLMDKLGLSEENRKNIRESYKNNPAALLDYLLKKTAPLIQAESIPDPIPTQQVITTQADPPRQQAVEQAKTESAQETEKKNRRGRPTNEEVAARKAREEAAAQTQPAQQVSTQPETQVQTEQPVQESEPAQTGTQFTF
jgi:recombination protein RecT